MNDCITNMDYLTNVGMDTLTFQLHAAKRGNKCCVKKNADNTCNIQQYPVVGAPVKRPNPGDCKVDIPALIQMYSFMQPNDFCLAECLEDGATFLVNVTTSSPITETRVGLFYSRHKLQAEETSYEELLDGEVANECIHLTDTTAGIWRSWNLFASTLNKQVLEPKNTFARDKILGWANRTGGTNTPYFKRNIASNKTHQFLVKVRTTKRDIAKARKAVTEMETRYRVAVAQQEQA
jgi:hypothetical protein